MDRKIIFFDIDGTLLDNDKNLPQSAIDSVQQLQHKGYNVAIATGRAPFTFQKLREQLGINTYVCLNGQLVVHDNEIIFANPFDTEQLEKLTDYSTQKQHPLLFVDDKEWGATMVHHPFVKEAIGSLKLKNEPLLHADDLAANDRYQMVLFCEAEEIGHYSKEFTGFNFIRWHDYAVDVLPKGSSKALGIGKLLEVLAIDPIKAYAFGDGLNDREMLTFIPNSVAMGNALDEVKSTAEYITTNVDDDGIYNGLQTLGLL